MTTVCISRSSESDPENEPRQPSLGSSPHSRRIAEDWNRGVASHGRQVHGPASEAALPNMANLSQESRQGLGFCRLLRCPAEGGSTARPTGASFLSDRCVRQLS